MKAPPKEFHFNHYICAGSVLGKCRQQIEYCFDCHPELGNAETYQLLRSIRTTDPFLLRCKECRDKNRNPIKYLKKDNRFYASDEEIPFEEEKPLNVCERGFTESQVKLYEKFPRQYIFDRLKELFPPLALLRDSEIQSGCWHTPEAITLVKE